MIMKLHTHAPHLIFDFEVKGQGHEAMMIEKFNGFQTITDPVINLWNFIHLLCMSQECALLILGQKVKGQGHGTLVIENGF